MSNSTVQAAAEGVSTETIPQLISRMNALRVQAMEASEIATALYDRGDRPEYPCVLRKEFYPAFNPGAPADYTSSKQIDSAIDDYIEGRRRHYSWMVSPEEGVEGRLTPELEARLAQAIEAAEQARERLKAMLDERKAVYDDWGAASGHTEATAKEEALWERLYDLERELFAAKSTSLTGLAAKASYIAAEYGDEFSKSRLYEFIQEVAAFAEPEAKNAAEELVRLKQIDQERTEKRAMAVKEQAVEKSNSGEN